MNSDYIGTGLNADVRLDDFVRCARCGFICKTSRDLRAHYGSRLGWGLRYERIYVDTTITTEAVIDDTAPSVRPRITTESGIAIGTEDGDTLITED